MCSFYVLINIYIYSTKEGIMCGIVGYIGTKKAETTTESTETTTKS